MIIEQSVGQRYHSGIPSLIKLSSTRKQQRDPPWIKCIEYPVWMSIYLHSQLT